MNLRVALLALFVTAAVSPATAIASSPASERTSTVYADAAGQPQRLTIKPHGYYSHVSLHNLQWSNWGQPSTSATGTFTFQFCVKESCSVSPFYDQPAAVTLSQIKPCRGRALYSLLTLSIAGPMPDTSFKMYQTSLGSCRPQRSGAHRKHR
jgi:hypothetical protein